MFKLNRCAGLMVGALAMAGGPTVSFADGMAPRGRAAAPMQTSWSGFYFGVGSGYQWSSLDLSTNIAAGSLDVSHDSGFVSAFLGVQHQLGLVVVGVEGGWKSTLRDDFGTEPCFGTFDCGSRLNDILTIGGRIGWAAGHWMPYLTGGYATARFDHEARVAATGALAASASTRSDGWYLGGGFDWTVSPGWTVGLEYRHYELGDDAGPVHLQGAPFAGVTAQASDLSIDTVSARVAWRWDIPGRRAAAPLK